MAAVLFATLQAVSTPASAAQYYWVDSSRDFNSGGSWLALGVNPTPTLADQAIFYQGSLLNQPQLTASIGVGAIQIFSGSPSVSFSASTASTLTIGTGGLDNGSSNLLSFGDSNLSLALDGNATFAANGTILIGAATSSFNLGGYTLTLSGTSTDSAISKSISSSSGSIVKGGTGSWELSATNSYTGSTTVNAGTLTFSAQANLSSSLTVNTGGTLRLAATDAFGSSAAVTLNGGTLQFSGGAFSQNFSGTPLSLTASSTIDFGSGLGASTLSFGSSSAQTWTGTLSIANYSAGSDVLRFGTDANALSPSQLAAINFSGFAAGAQIDSNGYVTPVPEPSTYALIFGSFAFGLSAYRLRKKNGRSEC